MRLSQAVEFYSKFRGVLMSDKYIRGYHGSIVLNELPGEYEVPWFTEDYAAYLQAALDDERSNKNLGRFFYIIAALFVLVGLTGAGGPSTIRIGPDGLTFFDMIRITSGPLISIGLLFATISSWLGFQRADPTMDAESYLLQAWRMKMPDGRYCDQALVVTPIAPGTFHIALAPEPH